MLNIQRHSTGRKTYIYNIYIYMCVTNPSDCDVCVVLSRLLASAIFYLSAKATEPSDLDLRNLEEDVGEKSEFSFVWFSGS